MGLSDFFFFLKPLPAVKMWKKWLMGAESRARKPNNGLKDAKMLNSAEGNCRVGSLYNNLIYCCSFKALHQLRFDDLLSVTPETAIT